GEDHGVPLVHEIDVADPLAQPGVCPDHHGAADIGPGGGAARARHVPAGGLPRDVGQDPGLAHGAQHHHLAAPLGNVELVTGPYRLAVGVFSRGEELAEVDHHRVRVAQRAYPQDLE